jgi:hypothetical protein
MVGKCPKCEALVNNVTCNAVQVNAPGVVWNGVSYSCPWCQSILSVAIDPIAVKADIVNDLVASLRKSPLG